jgi:hypothetical protein
VGNSAYFADSLMRKIEENVRNFQYEKQSWEIGCMFFKFSVSKVSTQHAFFGSFDFKES